MMTAIMGGEAPEYMARRRVTYTCNQLESFDRGDGAGGGGSGTFIA